MQYSSTSLIFRKGPRILTYRMPSRKKNKNWKRLKKNWLDSKIPCKTWILLKVFYVKKYSGQQVSVSAVRAGSSSTSNCEKQLHAQLHAANCTMISYYLMLMFDTISLCSPCWNPLFDSLASIFFLNPLEVAQNKRSVKAACAMSFPSGSVISNNSETVTSTSFSSPFWRCTKRTFNMNKRF